MIWVITERNVVCKLYKMRSFVPKQKKTKGVYYSSNYSDYVRWNKGIKEEEFIHALFSEEFSLYGFNKWFIDLYVKFRPVYLKTFHAELKKAIESCIRKGYIKRNSAQDGTFLMDEPEAKKLISWAYYPKLFFANKYVDYVVVAILAAFVGKILLPELTELYKLVFRK